MHVTNSLVPFARPEISLTKERRGTLGLDDDKPVFGCPICNENVEYCESGKRRMDGTAYPFPIYRCISCEFHFVDPQAYPAKQSKKRRA
jgi:transposase-like protein